MTSCLRRVVVQPGVSTTRLSWVGLDESEPQLAELPGGLEPAAVLAALFERPGETVTELTVLHPAGWSRARAAHAVAQLAGSAQRVRALPAALAVGGGPGPRLVVDGGASGTEVTLLGTGGVHAVRTLPVGGDRLDVLAGALLARPAPLAEVRRIRERLSLFPDASPDLDAGRLHPVLAGAWGEVVAAVHELACDGVEVVLVGGLARTPLLAELLDAAGAGPVRIADRPDVAAVRGALGVPWTPVGPHPAACPMIDVSKPEAAVLAAGSAETVITTPRRTATGWLPPLPPRRPLRRVLGAAAGLVFMSGLLAAGLVLTPRAAGRSVAAAPPGVLVQYGYALRLPEGWEHTGGLPERRRTLVTPVDAPDGSDLVSVERTDLGYDAEAEPARALAELRARYDEAVAGGATLSGFDATTRFAGRATIGYRQAMAGGTVVDWYVLFDRGYQLSVGCRHTAAGTDRVAVACATVVGSARRS